jgi:hypothetical protein
MALQSSLTSSPVLLFFVLKNGSTILHIENRNLPMEWAQTALPSTKDSPISLCGRILVSFLDPERKGGCWGMPM